MSQSDFDRYAALLYQLEEMAATLDDVSSGAFADMQDANYHAFCISEVLAFDLADQAVRLRTAIQQVKQIIEEAKNERPD